MYRLALTARWTRGLIFALCFLAPACLGPEVTPTPLALPTPTQSLVSTPTVPVLPPTAPPTLTPTPPTLTPAPPTLTPAPPRSTIPPTATPQPATRNPQSPTPSPPLPAATPATTNTLLLGALAVMERVQTYHYTATVQSFADGRGIQAVRAGNYQAPGALRWSTATGGLTTTEVLSGSLYYVAVGSMNWTLLPGAAEEARHQMLWTLIAQARNVVEVDRDLATTPQPAVHLAFALPLDHLPLGSHPWKLAQGDVWIGLNDMRIQAFKLYAQEPHYETTERLFLSVYNAPVQVALPVLTTPESGLQGRVLYLHRAAAGPPDGELRVRDLATGADELLLTPHGAVTGGAWSPDGQQVIFAANDILYLLNPASGDVQDLGRGAAPAWSPDGSILVFVRGSGRTTRAWSADPHVMAPSRLGNSFIHQLDWAPDGLHLLFTGWPAAADPETAVPQLFTMAADGSAIQPLAALPGGVDGARWSPDGTQIALVAGGHLALLNADGSTPVLLEHAGADVVPLWSPDGSTVLYGHRDTPAAARRLLVRPVDGGAARQLSVGDDLPLDWR